MTKDILESLKKLLAVPDLASKKWISSQYDSQVMNDTIQTNGDAAIVRVRDTKKALAISSDCTPRYVEADPFEGAIQAVAETYRNISSVGAKPLAITNCLNFGNPQKPKIMGQIVRAIKGITEASKKLDYPVISGNVSLYNETNGQAVQPTPTIGGVGLLKDLDKRTDIKFKNIGDKIYVIGNFNGHLDCSLYQREVLQIEKKENPPKVNLEIERKNSEFIRNLIENSLVNSCHDISDGGLAVNLFESCNEDLGVKLDLDNLIKKLDLTLEKILFGEEQSRYVISTSKENENKIFELAKNANIEINLISEVIEEYFEIDKELKVKISDLIKINEEVFDKKFS